MTERSCDLVVIGSGPGGYVAAIRAGQLGLNTVIVEAATPGGTCLNVGCIPSKALIHVADEFEKATHFSGASDIGVKVAKPEIDLKKTVAWKDGIVKRLTGGVAGLLKKNKVRHIEGWANFVDGKTVEDNIIDDLFDQLLASSDYNSRRTEIRRYNEASKVLLRGLAITPVKFGISFTATHLNQAGALVHVYKDGSVMINHGGIEMGQGVYIKVAQVVADEFGITIDRVRSTAADTSKVPNASATAASSGTEPRSGTPMSSASAWPPPEPNIAVTVPSAKAPTTRYIWTCSDGAFPWINPGKAARWSRAGVRSSLRQSL